MAYTIFEGKSRARSSASGRVKDTQNFKTITPTIKEAKVKQQNKIP